MIRFSQVTHKFHSTSNEDEIVALDNLSITIREAEYIAVLGPNGCGKSTFAKHMNALLLPTAGTVEVDAVDTAIETALWEIRQKVGMVFQNPDNQIVATTVEDDVAFGLENLGLSSEEIELRVTVALQQVGMLDYRKQPPHLLSGGQKQKVAIAGVIAMRPKYIVFDEATAMLDPKSRKELLQIMRSLNAEFGIAILNITHFMEEAVEADRILLFEKGNVLLDGTPKEVFRHQDVLQKAQMEVPMVKQIAVRLHSEMDNISEDLLTVEEMVNAICPLS